MTRPISFAKAKAMYPHRYTMEHIPAWARKPCNGRYYAPQFVSDREWYEKTTFPGERGLPRNEDHCETRGQSWPLGHWLKRPAPPYPAPHMWEGYKETSPA